METSITLGDRTNGVAIITLDQAKANSKIDYDEENDLLQLFIDATGEEFERFTGTVILEREVTIGLNEWPSKLVFPVGPVTSIESITYKDADGAAQTVADTKYQFLNYSTGVQKVVFKFEGNAPDLQDIEEAEFPISITVKAGYTTETMPMDIKKAALLHFSHTEMFREGTKVSLNHAVQSALRPHKKYA